MVLMASQGNPEMYCRMETSPLYPSSTTHQAIVKQVYHVSETRIRRLFATVPGDVLFKLAMYGCTLFR